MDKKQSTSNKNILITVLGWEERFIEGITIDIKKHEYDYCLIIIYLNYFNKDEYKGIMQEYQDRVKTLCEEQKIELSSLEFESSAPSHFLSDNKLPSIFNGYKNCNLTFDITSIPRALIWHLLSLSEDVSGSINLIYHKPIKYGNWLCRNFEKPILQIGHSGIFKFGVQTALIIITGFDTERSKQLITHFEPDKIFLCVQDGNQFDNHLRNIQENKIFTPPVEVVRIDSYDINSATDIVSNIADQLNDYNIILSSLGPKVSSIVAYNTYTKYPNIGLAYVPANEISIDYSTGIADSISYNIKE